MLKNIKSFAKKIIDAAEELDQDLVSDLLVKGRQCGYELSLLDSEEITWEASGSARYAMTRVDYELKLGPLTIVKWYAEYIGEHDCSGTGWWISKVDSDQPYWVDTLLEVAEIEAATPDVPEPESLDDFEDIDDEEVDSDDTDKPSECAQESNDKTIRYKPFSYETSDDHKTLMCKADCGDAYAQLLIGRFYEDGFYTAEDHDFVQDFVKAAYYYRKAADQGNTEAMFQLGIKYTGCWNESGDIVIPRDDLEVVKWIARAAELGHSDAQNYLGSMHLNGDYIEANVQEAIRWFIEAVNQGHPAAQCHLGAIYNQGNGVKQDYERAMDLFLKSANQENTDAQFNIGWMYDHGQGVERCKKTAKKWYKLACSKGHEIACEHLWKYKNLSD